MSEEKRIGRRGVMKRALTVLGAVAIAPTLLAGCGDDEDTDSLSCTSTEGLSEAEVTTRNSQAYTDSSTNADQNCANCTLYRAGQAGQCGTCTVIRGPIHPDGYCNLWAAQT